MNNDEIKKQADLEWENRVLCSDEACIGTVGPDGLCRECGKPFEGQLPDTSGQAKDVPGDDDVSSAGVSEQVNPSEDDNASSDAGALGAEADNLDDDWERRTLCSDEACIGTVGPDGLCKECGKPYEG